MSPVPAATCLIAQGRVARGQWESYPSMEADDAPVVSDVCEGGAGDRTEPITRCGTSAM